MNSSVKNKIHFLSAGIAFLIALIATPLDAQAQDPWPMFGQNGFQTRYSNFTGPLAPDLAWQYNTAGFTYSTPTSTDTHVYIASENELIALTHDGDEAWVFTFAAITDPPAVELSGLISTPAVAGDGTVYIGSLDHNLYAVNNNGNLSWSYDTGGEIFSSPTIGPDGTIYIGSRSGLLAALNPDGTLRWVAFTQGEILASPALDPDGNVYVGDTDNLMYGFNENGALLWTFQAQGEIVSSPAVANGNVYFGSLDNNVYAVNRDTGLSAWATPFSTSAAIISSPAVGTDGTVYIGSFDHRFYAINGTTGNAKWTEPFVTGSLIAASPALDGFGNIYITSLDGSMYVLSDATSSFIELWSFPTGSAVWASPTIGPNGTVYVAATGSLNEAGRLFAIHQATYSLTFASQLIAGQDAPFSVSITGAPVAASGTLFYRPAGATSYQSIPFSGNAIIPGTAITGTGLEYYIAGAEGSFPAESPALDPATRPVFINSDTSPDFLVPRVHRMVSVPYNLTSKSVQNVLGDDYQDYGPQSWRLHRWNGSGYTEYPSIQDLFEPGKAFFLITTHGDPFNVGTGFSVDTAQPFPVELQPGWNQIGNPFGFPVDWNRVVRNPEVVSAIAYFDGSEMIQDPDVVNALLPWEGYFVLNNSDEPVTILINPIPAAVEMEEELEEVAGKSQSADARIRISAHLDALELSDTQNWVGFAAQSSDVPDALDVAEAPPFGEHVRLSVVDAGQQFAINYKSAAALSASWDLSLTTSSHHAVEQNSRVRLTFEATPELASMRLMLVDQDYGYAREIHDNQIMVDWGDGLSSRAFTLIAGSSGEVDRLLGDLEIAPSATTLDQNFPNPFQQQTRIGYQLSERGEVSLTIYNLLGQEIQQLVDDTQNPGRYEVTWNGLDTTGRQVGSGVYIYRLQAGTITETGKMSLVR